MGFYMLTTVLAILSSTGIFYVFQPGDPRLASKLTADMSAIASSDVSISIKDTIVNIIPSNFVKPFSGIQYAAADFSCNPDRDRNLEDRRLFQNIEGYI